MPPGCSVTRGVLTDVKLWSARHFSQLVRRGLLIATARQGLQHAAFDGNHERAEDQGLAFGLAYLVVNADGVKLERQ